MWWMKFFNINEIDVMERNDEMLIIQFVYYHEFMPHLFPFIYFVCHYTIHTFASLFYYNSLPISTIDVIHTYIRRLYKYVFPLSIDDNNDFTNDR